MPSFRDLIAQNKSNSFWLIVGFCGFLIVVSVILGIAVMLYLHGDTRLTVSDWKMALVIGVGAGVTSFLISSLAFFQGDEFILSVHGAQQISHADDPELFNVVEEMAIAAGVPMPAVYLIPDDALNAFATGRDPKHASVAITTGLRNQLTRDELQGVLAHEMSHVRNYDIRLMLLTAVLVGSIVMLCDLFWRLLWYTDSGSSRRSDDGERKDSGGGGAIAIVLMVVAIVLAVIAPILAQLIQLAVSRQREYLADATAVELTRYPLGLANALKKLRSSNTDLRTANRGTAHLFIVNPVKKFSKMAETAFASHPPLEDRIRRLEALAHVQGERPGEVTPEESPAPEAGELET